jgi:glycosyltransferase involved in cell wall biosynthesis
MSEPAPRRTLAIVNNPVFGGGTNLVMQLAAPLRERGWETISMVPDLPEARPTLERLNAAGVPTGAIELHRLRKSIDPRDHWALASSFRREVRRLRGLIRRERIDLVQAFGDTNPHLALAGALERRAVVWTLYDTVTPPPARRVTMPLVTRVADVILTWGRALARAHPGAESLGERCITVYPPVDTDRFVADPGRRAAARRELGVPDDVLLVGTVGNRNPTKGHERLARALALLAGRGRDDVWARVLGAPSPAHADYMAGVDAEVERLGLSERFAFADPGTRVPELLPALDVFCISSVPRSEGMPTVIFEAMSCGLPVVTTDVGAVREFVEEGETGFVVPPLDDAALAGALERLLADGGLRARLGGRGRERVVERYDLRRCADVYAGAFELALEHRRRR